MRVRLREFIALCSSDLETRSLHPGGLVIGGEPLASGGRHANPSAAFPNGSDPETLFNTYGTWLLGSLRRRYGPELAEDLLQETYLRLLRQTEPVEILKPKAFLLQIARNLFLSGYRQTLRRAELDTVNVRTQARTEGGGQVEAIVLKQIILAMPQKLRDVFVLSRFGGMTNDAIADHLGIRPKTVESRMTQALAYCAAQLRA